jgi:hypothetical protein
VSTLTPTLRRCRYLDTIPALDASLHWLQISCDKGRCCPISWLTSCCCIFFFIARVHCALAFALAPNIHQPLDALLQGLEFFVGAEKDSDMLVWGNGGGEIWVCPSLFGAVPGKSLCLFSVSASVHTYLWMCRIFLSCLRRTFAFFPNFYFPYTEIHTQAYIATGSGIIRALIDGLPAQVAENLGQGPQKSLSNRI